MEPKHCPTCQRQYSPRNNAQKYCSSPCSHKALSHRIPKTCVTCGRGFQWQDSPRRVRDGGKGKYCSKECMDLDYRGQKHHRWKGGPVGKICVMCGKEFFVRRARAEKTNVRFCSQTCKGKWQSLHITGEKHPLFGRKPTKDSIERMLRTLQKTLHKRPNRPEQRFADICQKYDLPYDYVGDGSLVIYGLNPDFKHRERSEVVEIFGDYWHSPLFRKELKLNQTVEGRKEVFGAQGFKLLVLWENELDDEKQVLCRLGMEHKLKNKST